MKSNLIIDGNNLLHRAFWVSNINPDLNHISILLKSIKMYKEKFKPTDIYCAWDRRLSDEEPFRKSEDAEYKGNRDAVYNAEVYELAPEIEKIFESLGILNIHPERGEADDIIFYLTNKLEGKKIVVTVDTDMLQLIDSNTSVFSPIKKVMYDVSKFTTEYNMKPTQYAKYKSITGDKADNILGVYKFGNKKALKVLNGETALTEDQNLIVENNLKLINLNNIGLPEWDNEYETYNNQLAVGLPNPKFNIFVKLCNSNNLYDTLKQESSWHNLFFMDNVLNNTIAKLFS